MMVGMSTRRGLLPLLGTLARDRPARLVWATVVEVAAALTQGVGLLLLIPLLHLAGVGDTSAPGWAQGAFEAARVPLTLPSMLVLYVLLVGATAGLTAYSNVLLTRYRLTFVDDLRSRLYAAIAGARWRHLLSLRQSDLLSVLTVNVNLVSQGVLAVLTVASTIVVGLVQVAVAVRISPIVTALATATGIVLVVLVSPLVGRSRRLGRELVANNRDVLGSVTGFLDGLQLAKAHGLEAGHVTTFDHAIRRSRQSQVEFSRTSEMARAAQLVVTALVLAVLVYVAIQRLHLPLAGLLVVAFIFSRLVPQVTSAQQKVQQAAQSLPAFDELMDVIRSCEQATEPVEVAQRLLSIGTGVTLQDVSFAYPAAQDVLHGVSLDVIAHRTTALVGPSGAGKSTVATLVVGLLQPTRGRVLVDGRELADLRGWRASVGVVPQEPFLFHDTIRANLLWARSDATDADMWDCLAEAAADGFVGAFPDGLDSIVGDRGHRLSGGERQRIALARALLRQPDLLVLDEATSSLDTENERAIHGAFETLHGRLTMLVIAHRLSTVRRADHIVVLDGGRVVETGTWEELSERPSTRLFALIRAGAIA